ncbi:suppressor of glycerol defect protein 1 [Monosporozyma unispora]|nr:suppressor of glycerol defect [Kazachstania unispora]
MSKRQGINIPGIILDELKDRDYSNDTRFQTTSRKRGSSKQLNRKDRRKQQRAEKKQKRHHKGHLPQGAEEEYEPVLKPTHKSSNKLKHGKSDSTKRSKKSHSEKKDKIELPFSSDDELSEGDFDEFDENDLDQEEWEQLRDLEDESANEYDDKQEEEDDSAIEEDSSEDEQESEDKPMTTEETMAKLKKMKELKKSKKHEDKDVMTAEETLAALKAKKHDKKTKSKKDMKNDEEEVVYPLTPAERAALERDEMDMQYYAKKLRLKGKKKNIHARDEFDAIGGLLDGLEYFENYGKDDKEYGDFAIAGKNGEASSEEESEDESELESDDVPEGGSDEESEEHIENPFSSDDELSEGDFDEFGEDDLDEGEWEQLRELEGDIKSKSSKKENPYVAAAPADGSQPYVPPSLRKKHIEVTGEESAIIAEIRKRVKSSLNKLSDSNITVIITTLYELYDNYPRNYVTDVITKQIIEIIGQKSKLLDSFIMNYAAVAFAIFRLRGLETGASFIQNVVETFLSHYTTQTKVLENIKADAAVNLPKECNNIITLLAYCYNFGFISCRLIYDLIRVFVSSPNELTTELLFRVVAVSGQLIRGDDPSALKDILSELLTNVKGLKEQSPRLQFLLSTLSDLKNNRLKASVIAVDFHPLKKNIASTVKSTVSIEPLQVSLDDIKNVDTKGKWWLVGASWRGNMDSAFDNHKVTTKGSTEIQGTISLEDDLLDDIPDWDKIAREQRMNTDVRRAIFVSIMSAQDYIDAFEKLEKLNLKNRQLLEIPKVILHCLLADAGQNGYNPYYGLVVSKVCEQHHQLLKSFQFLFWETVKKFEDHANSDSENDMSDDEDFDGDEEKRLAKIANQGKFFGYLLSEGFLKLDSFKHVPIMGGLNSDGILFIEVILYFMLLSIGKQSEKRKGKDSKGNKTFQYTDERLNSVIVNGINIENKSTILKSLKWFISKKLKYKKLLAGNPGEKTYIRDKRRIEWAVSRFTELIDGEFDEIEL